MLERNPSRERLANLIQEYAASIPPGSRVLDAGAGDGPYRKLFDHTLYESADFAQVNKPYGQLTYVCRLDSVPVEDERYDAVLMSQVLEHLDSPANVLLELQRIIKPGCRLWLSAPLYYEEHEQPYDFYRYTQFGMRHLLEQAGFEVLHLESLEGYFGTLCYQTSLAAKSLPICSSDYGGGWKGVVAAIIARASRPLLRFASGAFAAFEMRTKYTRTGHCKNYYAIARKPLKKYG